MPARLILNADDFGLTPGINRAIGELNSAGVLSSATLMANGAAFDDAVAVTRAHPNLGVGCHIVLTDGLPVSPPASIPSLIGPDGKSFRPSLIGFIRALVLGRIHTEDVVRESYAQIEKLQRAGIRITHLDTHKHTHLFPAIARCILDVATGAAIPAIRNPFEPNWSLALNHGSTSRRIAIKLMDRLRPSFNALPQIRSSRVLTTGGTIAISSTGQFDGPTLAQLLAALPPEGIYELCCHPGYNDADLDRVRTVLRAHRDVERQALLAEVPRVLTHPNAPTLVNYASLAPPA
ncbi:MAG: ChbG/HpnK family deacetylase [Acidobacteriota bacterium]|nr:ChbG/HpnK family deacetylase [Acidobacteriota bacterium]